MRRNAAESGAFEQHVDVLDLRPAAIQFGEIDFDLDGARLP
jgi:hypothetical protein